MTERILEEKDKPWLAGWIAAEPIHQENSPEFYFQPKTKSIVYEDEQGPVFVVRYATAVRVDTEFNPMADKGRIRAMLKKVVPEVAATAQAQGFLELVFTSASKPLIAFCRLLGFKAVSDFRRTF